MCSSLVLCFVLIQTYVVTGSQSGVSSVDMKLHPRNPRIPLNILHPDAVNQIVAPCYHGKSHVIISLIQDYRHGAPTANNLLVPIGFSIYKVSEYVDRKCSFIKVNSCLSKYLKCNLSL